MYPIYTAEKGSAEDGAVVQTFALRGAGIDIPAILVGGEGRGRERGVLPVKLLPDQENEWKESGRVTIHAAELAQTRSGKPKLLATKHPNSNEKAIVLFRTHIGFRGANGHTGDRLGWECAAHSCDAQGDGPAPEACPECGKERRSTFATGPRLRYGTFPGEIICQGIIAQGDAGRMGSGKQVIALLPRNVVARTGYSGRLYGEPPAHYWLFDGARLLVLTWQERKVSDLF